MYLLTLQQTPTTNNGAYVRGCFSLVADEINKHASIIGGVAIGVIAVMVRSSPSCAPILRAGHFWYILHSFNNKKFVYIFFIKLIYLFLHQSYLKKKPTPSQINLLKNAKNHFLLLKK